MRKPKYEVGDYVRVCDNLSLNWSEGITPEIVDLAGKLVQISSIDTDDLDFDDLAYEVKELEGYYWKEDWFEYRLGNYKDNDIENHNFKYSIGYKLVEGATIHNFKGFIENFAPCGKSVFVDDNGKTLVLPWEMIEYIIPLGKESVDA